MTRLTASMNKGIMGIRTIAAIVGLTLAVTTAQAGNTNSWRATGASGFWDNSGAAWSLSAPPSLTDTADFITNVNSKTITIDVDVVSDSPSTLTISNLTLGGAATVTNTLLLNTSGTNTPLHVFNAMLVSNAAVLQITNSFLQVDGGLGGIFTVLGSMRILDGARVQLNKAVITNGAVLQFALGTNMGTVATTSDLTLGGTLNLLNGGSLTNTTYTLFTYGGVLNYNGLTIGTTPSSNFTYAVNTSTAGQVNLIVSSASSSTTNVIQLISIVRTNGTDIAITWSATGGSTSLVQSNSAALDGSYTTNNGFADISSSQFIAPGSGIATNTYTDPGGATNVPPHYYRVHYFQ
jgi:hypothetical protein